MIATDTLTDGEVRVRRNRLRDHLDSFGDLAIRDVGENRPRRLLEFRLSAPGDPCDQEVEALFREYYDRAGARGWRIAKYTYEYRDLRRGTRLAYHLHSLDASPELVPHAHCGGEAGDETGHLRAVPYELMEANAIFMKLYASDADPDCSAFLPLALTRP